MANLLPVPEQFQILSLHQKGFSNRRIAREIGVNRRSVARYIQGPSTCTSSNISSTGSEPISLAVEEPVLPAPEQKYTTVSNILAPGSRTRRRSLCADFEGLIREKALLGLRVQRIYQDLQEEVQFGGSYQSVRPV